MNFSGNNKNPIIITGFGRSGTSFLALFFQKLGFSVGGSWNNEIDGGMEASEGSDIFRYVNKNRLSKEEILNFILNMKKEVTKNPRFLDLDEVGLKTFQYWYEVWPELRVILMQRNLKDTIQSFNRIKNKKIVDVENEIKKRKKIWDRFSKYLEDKKINFIILNFPDFLKDYDLFYSKLESIGINFDEEKGKKIWDKQINLNKVHFRYGEIFESNNLS